MPVNAFNQLSNNISASLDRTGVALGFTPGGGENDLSPYPLSFASSINSNALDVSNWNNLPMPYTFSVVDRNGEPIAGFTDFELPLAPQNIMQTEMFATSIKPTQGGTVVTHSGNKYKALKISGTTGIAPFRGPGGVNRQTGEAYFTPGGLKFKSGYEVFIELRNYFKAYYEFKNTGQLDRNARIIFKNFKDGEFLVIELQAFNMKRSAGRPFLYDYDIDCKVLRAFQFAPPTETFLSDIENKINNALSKIETARGAILGLQGSVRQIESTYNSTVLEPLRQVSLTVKAFLGLANTIGDAGTRIIRNTFTLGGITTLLAALFASQQEQRRTGGGTTALANANIPSDAANAAASVGADAIIDLNELLLEVDIGEAPADTREALDREVEETVLPREFYDTTIANLTRVRDNLEDSVNLGSTDYDRIFGRTSTVTATTGRSVTNGEFDLLNSFNLAIGGIQDILATTALFRSTYADEIQNVITAFSDSIELEVEGATREVILPAETYLERMALIYLGNASRWPEIAVLNGLKPPYITQLPRFQQLNGVTDFARLTAADQALFNRSDTVASPGDFILVPASPFFGLVESPEGAENALTVNLSQVEKNLGVDLRVSEDFDLILTNSGDIEAVAGAVNMAQAILVRLQYEKGELLSNPEIGVGLIVGSKLLELNSIRSDIIRSLTQDSRVEDIQDFTISRDGPELRMRFTIKIKQVDQPIPLELALPVR